MDECALITGASRGIGFATAIELAKRGRDLLLIGRDRKGLNAVVERCISLGRKAESVLLDLNDIDSVTEWATNCIQEYPQINVLVNNAGIGIFGSTAIITNEEWDRIIKTNLTAPFILTRAVIPLMIRAGKGHIVNVSSDADTCGFRNASGYCASKGAILSFSRALDLELRNSGIRVTVISPGRVDTYFNNRKPGDRPSSLKPEDIAYAIGCAIDAPGDSVWQVLRIESIKADCARQ